VSIRYLPEHVEIVLLTLDLVEHEASYLAYTHQHLFEQPIDLEWINQLALKPELAEKIDAFGARFGRLQDTLGEKPKSLLDVLAYAERMNWINSAEDFIAARRLRNRLIHEYITDPSLFLEALQTAKQATLDMFAIVNRLRYEAEQLKLEPTA
jgi:uncharacterized protein YutE (UPF0331/DUF86 family)